MNSAVRMGLAEGAPESTQARSLLRGGCRSLRDPHRMERLDDADDYGETRWIVIGLVDGFLLVVVYVLRQDNIRIISARKANRNESKDYWNR
jgi:uncharacterized DUF497 family protein